MVYGFDFEIVCRLNWCLLVYFFTFLALKGVLNLVT